MAKRKARRPQKTKNNPPLWQWALIAIVSILAYQGITSYLNKQKTKSSASQPHSQTIKIKPSESKPSPVKITETQPSVPAGEEFSFSSSAKLLPKGSYQDNYMPITVEEKKSQLLAYAKLIPGKSPGPKGLTNTKPGLNYYYWKDKKFYSSALDFSALQNAVEGKISQKLSGPPQIKTRKPWISGEKKIYPMQLFLEGDPREIIAFAQVDAEGLRWAQVKSAEGDSKPAAFLKGATKLFNGEIKTVNENGTSWIFTESGWLDEAKPYLGYQWKVKAYRWDGESFVFDSKYSEKLTQQKQKS